MNAYTGFNNTNNTFAPAAIQDFRERVSYDPNGNILTYNRRGSPAAGKPQEMDDLAYDYTGNTNRLKKVSDAVPATNYTDDIDDQAAADNYTYDAIGNLVSDVAEGISNIEWTVYGKIKSITKTNGTVINYVYDASGNRIQKTVNPGAGGVVKHTMYARDASGNVMSIYEKQGAGATEQTENHLYGSSRIGMVTKLTVAHSTLFLTGGFENGRLSTFTRSEKIFELNNHLGNVLVTVSDKKIGVDQNTDGTVDYYNADVITANDYYPFGSQMPSRKYNQANTKYRYGFNGKENDNEVKGEGNQQDYGMRIYDPRIGRFLSVDPLGFSFPWYTPYQFAGNTPIQAVDLDGGEPKGCNPSSPYGRLHGSSVKEIPSSYDGQVYYDFLGGTKRIFTVYAIEDVDKKNYLIFQAATGSKELWYREYDKNGFKGNVNSFEWYTPPNSANALYAMTLGPLLAVPGGLIYGPALLRYLVIETGKEIIEEMAGVPVFDGPIDALKQYEKRKLTREAIKQSFEHLGKTTEESVRKKLKDYVLNKSHPVGGSKAKWFESALGFTQENMDDLAKQIKFDKSKAIKTELIQQGQKYNQVINITGANGKKIDVTFGFIENNDRVVRMTTAIPTKR